MTSVEIGEIASKNTASETQPCESAKKDEIKIPANFIPVCGTGYLRYFQAMTDPSETQPCESAKKDEIKVSVNCKPVCGTGHLRSLQAITDPLSSADKHAKPYRSSDSIDSHCEESSTASMKRSNSWPSGRLPCNLSTLGCEMSDNGSSDAPAQSTENGASITSGDDYSVVGEEVWDLERESTPDMHYDIQTVLNEFKEHAERENYSEKWLEFINEFLMPLSEPLVFYVLCSTNRLPTRFRSCHRIMKDETDHWSLLFIRKATLFLQLPYNHGQWAPNEECVICFRYLGGLTRLCCNQVICESCLNSYFLHKVENEGRVQISCPACVKFCERAEISFHLPAASKDKFYRFLVDANNDPNKKTCPRCNHITQRPKEVLTKAEKKYGLHVTCEQCNLQWCFNCQAPVHTVSCAKYRAGDILLRQWTKQFIDGNSDSRNARRCPNCHIFIQKSDGCNHMQCSRCGKRFCYACGCSMRSVLLLGSHNVRLSVLGCSKGFLPNRPHLRRFVRGSILSLGIAVSPVILVGGIGVGLVFGIYYGSRFIGKKAKRRIRQIRQNRSAGEVRIEHIHYELDSDTVDFSSRDSVNGIDSLVGTEDPNAEYLLCDENEDQVIAEVQKEIASIECHEQVEEYETSSPLQQRTSSSDYVTAL